MHNFRLHWLEFIKVYMANSLVPQLNIGLVLESLCIHRCVHLGRDEDKHVNFSSCMSDKLDLILNEANFLVESYLHSLLDNLATKMHSLWSLGHEVHPWCSPCYRDWRPHLQCAQSCVSGIITDLHHVGSIRFPHIHEPFLMACHVKGSWVHKLGIIKLGSAYSPNVAWQTLALYYLDWPSHHSLLAIGWRSWVILLLLALYFKVVKLSMILPLNLLVLPGWCRLVEAPPPLLSKFPQLLPPCYWE